MDAILTYFNQFGLDFYSLLKAVGIILLGSLLLGSIGRFIFGKRSALVGALSSAIGILFVYALNIVLHSLGAEYQHYTTPLPFVSVTADHMWLFPIAGAAYPLHRTGESDHSCVFDEPDRPVYAKRQKCLYLDFVPCDYPDTGTGRPFDRAFPYDQLFAGGYFGICAYDRAGDPDFTAAHRRPEISGWPVFNHGSSCDRCVLHILLRQCGWQAFNQSRFDNCHFSSTGLRP